MIGTRVFYDSGTLALCSTVTIYDPPEGAPGRVIKVRYGVAWADIRSESPPYGYEKRTVVVVDFGGDDKVYRRFVSFPVSEGTNPAEHKVPRGNILGCKWG